MHGKHFSRVLVAIDGSTSSMHAIDYAISIAMKNNSQLIILYIIDFYKYTHLSSSIILAPTFGSEKYLEEKSEAEKLMNKIEENFLWHSISYGNTCYYLLLIGIFCISLVSK